MSKWILLVCGIFLLLLSFWTLYYAYTPKVGPIGNGPNYILVWVQFIIQFTPGIISLRLAFNSRKKQK